MDALGSNSLTRNFNSLIMATFLDPNINAWWLERPNDKAMVNFQAGANRGAQQRHDDIALKMRMLDQAAEERKLGMLESQYKSKILTETMQGKGFAELSEFLSTATANGTLADPATESQFWKITSKYAPFMPPEMVNSVYDNTFKAARDRADKGMTADIKNAEQADEWLQEANIAMSKGDKELADRLRAKAERLSPKGFALETYTDEAGNQQFRMTQGIAGGTGSFGKPTGSVITEAQKRLSSTEKSVNLLTELERDLRPQDIGVAGVVGETVLDRLAGQIPGMESIVDLKRADNRTKLKTAIQGWVRLISTDERFTDEDRKRAEEVGPSSGALESYPRAIQSLQTLKRIFVNRAKKDIAAIGQQNPEWSLTPEEIKEQFQAGKISEDKAFELIRKYWPGF